MPGAGRCRRAVGCVAARARAAAAADRRHRRPGRDTAPLHRRIGRHDGAGDGLRRQTVGTGNFDPWADGPALPEPRTDAAVAFVAGSVYVIGGIDADGAPTTTTYVLTPDGTTGELGDWKDAPTDARAARGPRRRGGRPRPPTACC